MLLENEPQLVSPEHPLVPHDEILLLTASGITVEDSVRALLTETLLPAVDSVLEFMRLEACRHNIPVYQTNLHGHTGYDDGSEHIIITQVVDLPATEALAYWKKMFQAFNPWFATLSIAHQTALQTYLIPTVRWNSNATAY